MVGPFIPLTAQEKNKALPPTDHPRKEKPATPVLKDEMNKEINPEEVKKKEDEKKKKKL